MHQSHLGCSVRHGPHKGRRCFSVLQLGAEAKVDDLDDWRGRLVLEHAVGQLQISVLIAVRRRKQTASTGVGGATTAYLDEEGSKDCHSKYGLYLL